MRLTYDPRHNIAYLRLQEKTAQVETVRVSESLNVDLAPDGTVYGIELLNANEQLRGREAGKLIVENVATGTSAEVDLLKNLRISSFSFMEKLETAKAQPQSEQRHFIPSDSFLLFVPRAIWQRRQGLGSSLMLCYGTGSRTIGITGTLELLERMLA